MIDRRFITGLKNFSTSNKSLKQVTRYLGVKATLLGVGLPKYITDMKNVSPAKVDRFINRLINKAEKEVRKSEIAKVQQEASVNKLKNAIKNYNKKVDTISNQMYKTYTDKQVRFLQGESFRVVGEMIHFDGSNGLILQKMNIDDFEFSSKENMDNFTKDLINTTKNMSFEKYDEELLDTDTVQGLSTYYEDRLSNFLNEFNELQYGEDFDKIGERYKKLNKVQKNMFVQGYKNNMRDDYPVPVDQEGQNKLELNYLNKMLSIMNFVEGL
jgi:hypothetical protein